MVRTFLERSIFIYSRLCRWFMSYRSDDWAPIRVFCKWSATWCVNANFSVLLYFVCDLLFFHNIWIIFHLITLLVLSAITAKPPISQYRLAISAPKHNSTRALWLQIRQTQICVQQPIGSPQSSIAWVFYSISRHISSNTSSMGIVYTNKAYRCLIIQKKKKRSDNQTHFSLLFVANNRLL